MISEEYIAKLKRMGPKRTVAAGAREDGINPVPLDFRMFEDDMVDHNFLICSIEVLHQILKILPQLPYMEDVKPCKVENLSDRYIAFDMWYPVVKRVVFAPSSILHSEYWAVSVSLDGNSININDVQNKPHHMIGVTSD